MKLNPLLATTTLLILTGAGLTVSLPAQAEDIYVDGNCRHDRTIQPEWNRLIVFYGRKFTANNQDYWLYAAQYQDGAVIFCISRPNFVQPKLIEAEQIDGQFIERIEQNGNDSPRFRVQVREGQNINVPLVNYSLDLSNPDRPSVTYISRQ